MYNAQFYYKQIQQEANILPKFSYSFELKHPIIMIKLDSLPYFIHLSVDKKFLKKKSLF